MNAPNLDILSLGMSTDVNTGAGRRGVFTRVATCVLTCSLPSQIRTSAHHLFKKLHLRHLLH